LVYYYRLNHPGYVAWLAGVIMIIDIMDIMFRGTTAWLQSGDVPRVLAVRVFGAWMIYQFFLHIVILPYLIRFRITQTKKEVRKMKNNRGWVALLGPQIIAGVAFLAVVSLPFMTPGFRTQKAIDTCIYRGDGDLATCTQKAKGMTTSQKKAYVRDTIEHPQPACDGLGG